MMTDAELPQFTAALAELAALKPGAKLTPEAYTAWWNAMRERWTLQAFREACARLRDTCEFMPNPYHFEQLRKAGEETPAELWVRVCRLVQLPAELRKVSLENDPLPPRAQRAVHAMGGWYALEMAETATRHFREKRFAELVEELGEVDKVREALPSFAGARRLGGPQKVVPKLERHGGEA